MANAIGQNAQGEFKQNTLLLRMFFLGIRGATVIEYALIAGGIALAIFTSVNLSGTDLNLLYDKVRLALINSGT